MGKEKRKNKNYTKRRIIYSVLREGKNIAFRKHDSTMKKDLY